MCLEAGHVPNDGFLCITYLFNRFLRKNLRKNVRKKCT